MKRRLISLERVEKILAAPEMEDAEQQQNRRRQLNRMLTAAIRQELTARQRDCVQLYFYDRLTQQEIGERLGIGKATVCRHLQKAKARLRHSLQYLM